MANENAQTLGSAVDYACRHCAEIGDAPVTGETRNALHVTLSAYFAREKAAVSVTFPAIVMVDGAPMLGEVEIGPSGAAVRLQH